MMTNLLNHTWKAIEVNPKHPVLVGKFLENDIEVDADAICDGKDVLLLQ